MTISRSNPRAKQRWTLLATGVAALMLLATAVFAVPVVDSTATDQCDIQATSKTGPAIQCITDQGARVSYIPSSGDDQSSGTGNFDPFVRLQGDPAQSGYNTDGALQFESKGGKWTHAILASDIPVVDCDGLGGSTALCYQLFVDINEGNSSKQISLNEVEIWFTTDQFLTGYVKPTGFPTGATLQYDFSGEILINDVNQGSGRGDLLYLVPLAGLDTPTAGTYFLLYSEWSGTTAGPEFNSDGGFEEWKVLKVPPRTSLTLDKVVTRDNGGTAAESLWNLTATGALDPSTDLSGPGAAGSADVVSGPLFNPDTYTLAESGTVSGYTNGLTYSCVKTPAGGTAGVAVVSNSIILASGDSAICTITNNDNPPSLILDKVVTSDQGGTAAASSWNLTATGALLPEGDRTNLSGPGAAGSTDVVSGATFKADTYTLAETGGVAGYTNGTTYSCVKTLAGGSAGTAVLSNSITLANGDSAICTITNTDDINESSLNTAPWIYPNDKATVTAAAGQTDIDGNVTFKLYGATDGVTPKTASDNCLANGALGLLYSETVALPAAAATAKTVNTSNPGTTGDPTSRKVESTSSVFWRVAYDGDTNHLGRLSNCVENINVLLTNHTGGTNVPAP